MSTLLEFRDLAPEPVEEWRRLLRFVGWGEAERGAAARSVEPLFRQGPALVEGTYNYLAGIPETAAVLGWEERVDSAHLEERRRFFTLWLARTLGLDTSDEFALELFRGGLYHAGLGPRRVQVPSEYVTGSIGLVLASFSQTLATASLPADALAAAMAAWSKYLTVQLDLMLLGYRAARDLTSGSIEVRCALFGRLRSLLGARELTVRAEPSDPVGRVLGKLFNTYPRVRAEVLDRRWESHERGDSLWREVQPTYVPRHGWRVLLNGREIGYDGGLDAPVGRGDELALFPPGR